MSELLILAAKVDALAGKLDAVVAAIVGPRPEGNDVGYSELTDLLAVGNWRPSVRTVKNFTHKYRHILVRVTQRPVSYSRASVMAALAQRRAGKKQAPVHGRRRL